MMPGNDRQDVNRGGKIILPSSALDNLTHLHIQYPMLFKLSNAKATRESHSGVLEFVADEGRAYLPYWMMNNLCLEEGSMIHVENVSLPVASFAKFQPQSSDFLDITNPKAVLENALRNFACLTTGDMIAINYNDKIYELKVLETKPQKAVSIIECDMSVDFAPPIGYQEPIPSSQRKDDEEEMAVDISEYIDASKFRPFGGRGNRLDGKEKLTQGAANVSQAHTVQRGIPNYDYKKGKITFIRASRQVNGSAIQKKENDNKENGDFSAFSGEGYSLRKKPTKK
jgi:ubiquitin fusion degradation protein 1